MSKHTHMIGICGAGMSAVARLLQESGATVTGSDQGFYPPVSDYIDRLGLRCEVGHRAENIPDNVDHIVIGKHAKLVPDENDEVRHAFDAHRDKIVSFPEVLARLTADRQRLVVAGSYGKSSITSLIAWCLSQAGKDPGWFIGAIPKGFDHSAALGSTGPFVFEGDEYPSANWDDRPKFAHYSPHTVLLTSATHDHVNIYPTLADYHAPFLTLLEGLAERGGTLVACTDESEAATLFHRHQGPKVSYGIAPGTNYGATHIELGDPILGTPTRFSLLVGHEVFPGFTTPQLGRHAVQNAVAAAAMLLSENHLTTEELKAGIATFEGLNRRLDRKAPQSALPIFEGFGSSFEKARAAIDAIKAHLPQRRLVALFEPHTFTWRNKSALPQYQEAFRGTDQVWIYAPPGHGADTHDQASHEDILAVSKQFHSDVQGFGTGELTNVLDKVDPDNDVVLVLSSGSFDHQLADFFTSAEARFPAS